MRLHVAAFGTFAMTLVAGSLWASEPKYSLHDHSLVVDGDTHAEIPIPCDEIFVAALHGNRIFVACGKQGVAVFVDPMHPRFEAMAAASVSCIDLTIDGTCVGRAEEPDTTVTHITGAPKDLDVQTRNLDGTWSTVCTGTCDRPLPTHATYRVDGPGLRASKPFSIDGRDVHLNVTTGSWAGFAGGITMVVLGIGGGAVGAGAVLLDGLIHVLCQGSSCGGDALLIPGLIGWLGGAGVATSGLYLIRGNGRTKVGGAMAATTARLPAWREIHDTPTMPRLGAVTSLPLFSGTF